jgi:hypothetical protein
MDAVNSYVCTYMYMYCHFTNSGGDDEFVSHSICRYEKHTSGPEERLLQTIQLHLEYSCNKYCNLIGHSEVSNQLV